MRLCWAWPVACRGNSAATYWERMIWAPGGQSPVKGGLPPCQYCHAPHSGNQQGTALGPDVFFADLHLYRSTTDPNQTMEQPPIGAPSSLCLSCHDGTIAPGQTVPYGKSPDARHDECE